MDHSAWNGSPRAVIMPMLPNMKNRAIPEMFAIPPGRVSVAPAVRIVPRGIGQ
jgi:hypothetical protein